MAALAQTFPRRTVANSVAIFGGEALARASTFAMAVIIARRFGPVALGQYGYALALTSILLLVPDLGLQVFAIRELAADRGRLRTVFWSLHWLKLPLAALTLILAVTFGTWGIQDGGMRLLFYVLTARILLQTFSQVYMAVFKAFERMHYVALQQAVNALLLAAWAGLFLGLHAGLGVVVFALVAGQTAETWMGWRLVRTNFSPGGPFRWDTRFLGGLLLAALPIGITAILQALNLRIDILILGLFAADRELGNFQAAVWFPIATFLFATLLMTVLFPKLSRLLHPLSPRGREYLDSLLKTGVLLATLGSLTVWLAAPHLLRWCFGGELEKATGTLRILAASLPFVFLNTAAFYIFVAAERRMVYMGILILGVGLGALLNFSLARRYGAAGSALADLAREFTLSVTYLYYLTRESYARSAGKALLKVFLGAAGLMALQAFLLGPLRSGGGWPATWDLLMLAGTLLFLGWPCPREWLLLADDTL
jgi:O-antigen/teichoic acid export membrane protein